MFNENEIIHRVLVVNMDEIILVHEHEFYTKIEKNIYVLFPGTYSMYFILPHLCVQTLMAVFHLNRNTSLYTVLSLYQGHSYK